MLRITWNSQLLKIDEGIPSWVPFHKDLRSLEPEKEVS